MNHYIFWGTKDAQMYCAHFVSDDKGLSNKIKEQIMMAQIFGLKSGRSLITCDGDTFEDVKKYDPFFEDAELVTLEELVNILK